MTLLWKLSEVTAGPWAPNVGSARPSRSCGDRPSRSLGLGVVHAGEGPWGAYAPLPPPLIEGLCRCPMRRLNTAPAPGIDAREVAYGERTLPSGDRMCDAGEAPPEMVPCS